MSKAFTKEDDDGGVSLERSASFVVPVGPFRLTARGAALLAASPDPRLRDLLPRAEVLAATPSDPDRAMLGVTVHARAVSSGESRTYRLVTTEERGLLGDGCSILSPLGRALLGCEVGDSCEVRAPRGRELLEVVALEGETSP